MTDPNDGGVEPVVPENADNTHGAAEPTLAEDLLLLLFQPDSKTIAGEGTLFNVLAGAVLVDLGFGEHVRTGTGLVGSLTVEAIIDRLPSDRLLRATWDYVAEKPRSVMTVLAEMGPELREQLVDRLVEERHLRQVVRKTLGIFETKVLLEGDTGRRAELLRDLRAVLVDGAEPTPRIAALAALVYASGTLPQFNQDIPWSSPVIARAEELKDGHWGAGAAATAVTHTLTTIILSNVVAVTAAMQRR